MAYSYKKQPRGFATKAVHAGQDPEKWSCKSVAPPISLSISFKQDLPAQFRGFEYARADNPCRESLETCIAALENAKHALSFSAGMGAFSTLFELLSAGDHLLIGEELYGGTTSLATKIGQQHGVEVSLVDTTNLDAVKAAIKSNTRMLLFETPTNPKMLITDIEAISKICHEHDNFIVAVDNTFMTSYFQRPLELGADIVCYSITKFMNGHTDVLMGAICTSSEELYKRLKYLQVVTGAVPSPFDCYQVMRSLKTLPMRMEQHMKNCIAIGKAIEKHAMVEKIMHPALPSHPSHKIAVSQSYGYCGMFSFYANGNEEQINAFFAALKIFTIGTSLGGVQSLIALPTIMTHGGVPKEQKLKLGITDNLIRVSVGVEDTDDLVEDFINALDVAYKTK